jgi:hypothetical protein
MKAPEILEKAAQHLRDRAATYDKPEGERSMAQTVAVFNLFHGTALTETQGWHFMQILKAVRMFARDGYHADSAEDLTAYGALMGEARARESHAGFMTSFERLAENFNDVYENARFAELIKSDLQESKSTQTVNGKPFDASAHTDTNLCTESKPKAVWIEWTGGNCPVAGTVEYRLRGFEETNVAKAASLFWKHDGTAADIIAYRVVKKAAEGEWIKLVPGLVPILSDDDLVQFRLKNGVEGATRDWNYEWSNRLSSADVIAYRVVKKAAG